MNIQRVRQIATNVRRWAERKNDRLDMFYSDLCGMCAIASAELFCRLKNEGFKPVLVHAFGHVYVELEGYIVDVTCTQFSIRYPKVMVRKRERLPRDETNWRDREFWDNVLSRHRSIDSLRRKQESLGWPEEQMV